MQKFAFKIDIHHRPDVEALLLNEMNLKKQTYLRCLFSYSDLPALKQQIPKF